MLTSKQRAFLRALGNQMEPIFQIGKAGVTEELLEQLDDALEARELFKVRVLRNCPEDLDDVADQLSEGLDCDIVQKIGHNILIYRESIENPRIELP